MPTKNPPSGGFFVFCSVRLQRLRTRVGMTGNVNGHARAVIHRALHYRTVGLRRLFERLHGRVKRNRQGLRVVIDMLRQRLVNFDQTAAVRLHRRLNRRVDNIHLRARRDRVVQRLDIVVAQTNTAGADAHADAEIGIGAVQEIDSAIGGKADSVMAHRVVRTGRHHRRQLNPHRFVARANVSGWRPGRISPLVGHGGDHRRCDGGSAQLADADRVDGHFILARRVIVEAQFGKVDHQPFARRIGQQRLQGDSQHAAGARNIGVYPGIGLQQGQKADIVLFGNRLQRTAVILHHMELILPHQPAARRGKGPGVSARRQRQRGNQRDQRQGETVSHYHNSKIYNWLFLYEKGDEIMA
ncbi:hypothetical protein KPSB59_1040029 [Klebsiella quasipneumoniae subsp. quasipneumoniae]|nr:hypothetical protein KPSB59_1040029 [Klebsiella quasipneumoniae subsp. quasipneumoniae]